MVFGVAFEVRTRQGLIQGNATCDGFRAKGRSSAVHQRSRGWSVGRRVHRNLVLRDVTHIHVHKLEGSRGFLGGNLSRSLFDRLEFRVGLLARGGAEVGLRRPLGNIGAIGTRGAEDD